MLVSPKLQRPLLREAVQLCIISISTRRPQNSGHAVWFGRRLAITLSWHWLAPQPGGHRARPALRLAMAKQPQQRRRCDATPPPAMEPQTYKPQSAIWLSSHRSKVRLRNASALGRRKATILVLMDCPVCEKKAVAGCGIPCISNSSMHMQGNISRKSSGHQDPPGRREDFRDQSSNGPLPSPKSGSCHGVEPFWQTPSQLSFPKSLDGSYTLTTCSSRLDVEA